MNICKSHKADINDFRRAVKIHLKEQNMTIRELARKTGLSDTAIHFVLKKRDRDIQLKTFYLIGEALKINPGIFFDE